MNLNINNESKNLRNSQQKRYGNLVVDTTIKADKGIIDLKNPVSVIQRNLTAAQQVANNTSTIINNSDRRIETQNIQPTQSTTVIRKTKDISLKNSVNTSCSTSIMRGQKVSINSKTQNLSKILIALEWNVDYRGSEEFDLDTSVFMVDGNNNTAEQDFIFYGNPKSKNGSVSIGEDHNSSLKRAYDSVVQLNLDKVPMNIEKLAFTVTIYDADKRHESFRQVSGGCFRVIDGQAKKELINYKFGDGLTSETAIVVAEVYRHKNEWKVNPIGNGFNGGLEALCNNYGIETE
ncbi:TerD family protein [Clostridium sp.]|jgi:tellurium resistance protein TerD|uniref:TerD family protein n=1 Tax=Clostridium sp. TaxID=1506 RepID=UPI0039F452EA